MMIDASTDHRLRVLNNICLCAYHILWAYAKTRYYFYLWFKTADPGLSIQCTTLRGSSGVQGSFINVYSNFWL